MTHVLTIASRELRSLFVTPAAYVVLAASMAFAGFLYGLGLGFFLRQVEQIQAYQAFQMLEQMNLNQMVIAPSIGTFAILFVFAVPLLTMRAFAEERANGTIELLLTSPVSSWEIVLGKYLAVLAVIALMVLLSAFYPGVLFLYGNPEIWLTLAALVGLFLLGAGLAALGCFVSSLTRSQIVAALIGIIGGLVLWLVDLVADSAQADRLAEPIRYLGIRRHFEESLRGLIRLQDLAYFGIFVVFFLSLARTSVESLRWR